MLSLESTEEDKKGRENMEKRKNEGSASIFMVLLLIPTVICMCILIRYAQLISAKGMLMDAQGLAENAVVASYNRPIKETYGIVCYTKPVSTMNSIGNYYLNKSLPDNMRGEVFVSYSPGYELTDDAFVAQIRKYMTRWDKVASVVDNYKLISYKQIMNNADFIRESIQVHYNNAINAEGKVEFTYPEAQQQARQNAIPHIKADSLHLDADCVTLSYGNENANIIPSGNREISYQNDMYDNVLIGLDMINNISEYYAPLNDAIISQRTGADNYMLALYVCNNFSAFKYFGNTSLTGNDYESGDVVSVCRWSENEFVLNGTNDSENNTNKIKYLIFESLFAENLALSYNNYINDEKICEYAELVAGTHTAYIPLIKDEMIIGICAKNAYDQMLKVYRMQGDMTLKSYPEYIQMFNMVEVERNKNAYLDRVKFIITTNVNNSPNAEAREFNFNTAKTKVIIEESSMELETSF